MSERPDVSVVIVTRNREERLKRALEALADQSLQRERLEVIVVRAADTPPPWTDAPEGLKVRFITHRGSPGEAIQRNVGWRAARAPLIAFTDDDCRPHPEWAERILAAWSGDSTLVQGRTEPDPQEAHLLYGLARTIAITGPTWRFETCNMGYPRELLERLGGFDERISSPMAWTPDTEMGLRAVAAGGELRYADDALVWHAVIPRTLADALRETPRYAWLVRLLARHPEHRRRLYPRRLLKGSHATLLVAIAGIVVLRRRPVLGAALITPYIAGHVRTHLETNPLTPASLARFAMHVPKPTLVELAELAVVVRAAVRYRTLVI